MLNSLISALSRSGPPFPAPLRSLLKSTPHLKTPPENAPHLFNIPLNLSSGAHTHLFEASQKLPTLAYHCALALSQEPQLTVIIDNTALSTLLPLSDIQATIIHPEVSSSLAFNPLMEPQSSEQINLFAPLLAQWLCDQKPNSDHSLHTLTLFINKLQTYILLHAPDEPETAYDWAHTLAFKSNPDVIAELLDWPNTESLLECRQLLEPLNNYTLFSYHANTAHILSALSQPINATIILPWIPSQQAPWASLLLQTIALALSLNPQPCSLLSTLAEPNLLQANPSLRVVASLTHLFSTFTASTPPLASTPHSLIPLTPTSSCLLYPSSHPPQSVSSHALPPQTDTALLTSLLTEMKNLHPISNDSPTPLIALTPNLVFASPIIPPTPSTPNPLYPVTLDSKNLPFIERLLFSSKPKQVQALAPLNQPTAALSISPDSNSPTEIAKVPRTHFEMPSSKRRRSNAPPLA